MNTAIRNSIQNERLEGVNAQSRLKMNLEAEFSDKQRSLAQRVDEIERHESKLKEDLREANAVIDALRDQCARADDIRNYAVEKAVLELK